MDFLAGIPTGMLMLLFLSLFIAFAFEFVNGFHDTANAVATVIYTNSLKPRTAVVWSGCWNFLGVLLSGIGVAYSIVNLLPVDLLIESDSNAGLAMVLSLLISAIVWNVGTWYLGLPASSSHALIGSILGVGLVHGLFNNKPFGAGVNWGKAQEVGMSLLLSPLFGFCLAGMLLLLCRRLIRIENLYQPPVGDTPPPPIIRGVLIFTCTGVSFGHGSNDGQKGMGLIMLILIGILPAQFVLNQRHQKVEIEQIIQATQQVEELLPQDADQTKLKDYFQEYRQICGTISSYSDLQADERLQVRKLLLQIKGELNQLQPVIRNLPEEQQTQMKQLQKQLATPIEYVPTWVVIGVALSLGIGTMVGWKRIVVTVGEKIGKTHLTYAQGACAEVTAMSTILVADLGGLPVSTTQVLSSGVAGTMAANNSGINPKTVRSIALAWLLTLPATMTMSALFFSLARWFIV